MKRKKKIRILQARVVLRIPFYRFAHISLLGRHRLILSSLPLLRYSHLTSPALPRINFILPRMNVALPRMNVALPRMNVALPRMNVASSRLNKRRHIPTLTPNNKRQPDKVWRDKILPHTSLYKVQHVYSKTHYQTVNQHHSLQNNMRDRKLLALHQHHHLRQYHAIQDSSGQHSSMKQYLTKKYDTKRYVNQQNITYKDMIHENNHHNIIEHHHIKKGNIISLIKNINQHDGGIKAVQHRLIQQIAPLATQAKQAQQAQSAVKTTNVNHEKSKAETPPLDYGQIRQMMRDEMAQMARQLQHVIRAETRNDFLETSRIRARDTQKKGL
ncbi:MAG: hypothetical protein K0U39_01285 [Alphaproteobacteria bacterium]|nr:hypothetical protein [Alphaproteobacteria bacterium]